MERRDEIAGVPLAYRSENEFVLVKPQGAPCELTSDPRHVSLLSRLRDAGYPEARLPHRLDRGTRGFVLVALGPDAIRFHNEEVRARRWEKTYLARVVDPGASRQELVGEHKAYLKREKDRMSVVRSGGKPSFLRIVGVSPAPNRAGEAHVVIALGTGRYHQIRAMLANLGAPLVGDPFYGREGGKRADGGVRGKGGPPEGAFYLEHAVFGFRPFRGTMVRLFDPVDPAREPVAREIHDLLVERAAEGPAEGPEERP